MKGAFSWWVQSARMVIKLNMNFKTVRSPTSLFYNLHSERCKSTVIGPDVCFKIDTLTVIHIKKAAQFITERQQADKGNFSIVTTVRVFFWEMEC